MISRMSIKTTQKDLETEKSTNIIRSYKERKGIQPYSPNEERRAGIRIRILEEHLEHLISEPEKKRYKSNPRN